MEFQTLGQASFSNAIADPAVQLIDVRTADEYAAGHLPYAMNIDIQRFDFDQKAESLDKDHPVAVYCRSGARSKIAAAKLAAKGYKVVELDGGILHWTKRIVK